MSTDAPPHWKRERLAREKAERAEARLAKRAERRKGAVA